MPGFVVDSTSIVQCIHQAPAPLTAVPRVLVNLQPVATVPPAGPRIPVTACPFMAGTKPQPCVVVEWVNVSTRVRVLGLPLYLQVPPPVPGNGLCKSIEMLATPGAAQGLPTLKKLQTRVLAT